MSRKHIHPGIAVLKQRLHDWLAARRKSDSDFVRASGLSDSTVSRLLKQPGYASTADTWRIVARVCGWSEDEVLVTGGFQPSGPTLPDGWALVTQGLLQLGLSVRGQEMIRDHAEALLAAQVRTSPPGPSNGGS